MNVDIHRQHRSVESVHENALRNFGSNAGQRSQKGFCLVISHFRYRRERRPTESPPQLRDNLDHLTRFELAEPARDEDSLKDVSVFREYSVPTREAFLEISERAGKAGIACSRRQDNVDQVIQRIPRVAVPGITVSPAEDLANDAD
ncbi:MAG TPA: hypothetical protein VMD77_11675 [Candidatus Baltobacteraceae bacterium]|nr:hypothetical protein [Candidatus Baltobacteraceae bacterium]